MSEEEVLKLSEEDLEIYNVHTQNFDRIVQMKSPRFIKSHLPFQVLPQTLLDTAKVEFLGRTFISYTHINAFQCNNSVETKEEYHESTKSN